MSDICMYIVHCVEWLKYMPVLPCREHYTVWKKTRYASSFSLLLQEKKSRHRYRAGRKRKLLKLPVHPVSINTADWLKNRLFVLFKCCWAMSWDVWSMLSNIIFAFSCSQCHSHREKYVDYVYDYRSDAPTVLVLGDCVINRWSYMDTLFIHISLKCKREKIVPSYEK